jgi:hypothetical protein
MDEWHTASGVVSLACAAFLSWIVLHPRINEGVLVKAGLITMITSLLVTGALTLGESYAWSAYWRAGFLLRLGLLLVCVGVFVRVSGCCGGMPRRRMSDWLHHDGSHPAR